MIKLSEIVEGVAAAMSPLAYALYDEEPKQPAKDAVYITAEPVSSETIGGGRMRDNLVLIDLAYVKDGTLKRGEYYGYIAECDRLLRPVLEFAGRKIMPEDIAARNVDGVAHYTFMLAFFDTLEQQADGRPAMGVLKLKVRE